MIGATLTPTYAGDAGPTLCDSLAAEWTHLTEITIDDNPRLVDHVDFPLLVTFDGVHRFDRGAAQSNGRTR